MKFPQGLLIPAIALMVAALNPGRSVASPLSAQPEVYGQERGWDAPPGEFNEAQRRGFHDGVEGARRDFDNHRRPDVENRDEFRNPHIESELRDAYRDGFRRGYEVAASHLWGAPPQPPPPPPPPPPVQEPQRPNWDAWGMRGMDNDAQRRGYRDGADEARNDFQLQRRPDPDSHREYQQPQVPPEFLDDYREGFMRGYEVTRSQLAGEPSWQDRGDPDRWEAQGQFTEVQRRGFHDGVVGAQRDHDNHRRPNVANRDEYRDPHVADELKHEYREGFRRGYEMMAARLWGGE